MRNCMKHRTKKKDIVRGSVSSFCTGSEGLAPAVESRLFYRHPMNTLQVNTEVAHPVGDPATDRAGRGARVDLTVKAQRVDVPVGTATYVAGVAL